MKKVFLFIAVLSVFGCKTPAIDYAKECAERYPVQPKIEKITVVETRLETLPAQISERIRFVDTTVCPPSPSASVVTKVIERDCPQQRTVLKTIIQRDSVTHTVVDKAAQDSCLRRNNELTLVIEGNELLIKKLVQRTESQSRQLRRTYGFIAFVILFFGFLLYLLTKKNDNQ